MYSLFSVRIKNDKKTLQNLLTSKLGGDIIAASDMTSKLVKKER